MHSLGRGRLELDSGSFDAARLEVARFWDAELSRGAVLQVPERRVLDAERSLLVQQRVLTWRYSVGNPYEELSFAEALDAARVMPIVFDDSFPAWSTRVTWYQYFVPVPSFLSTNLRAFPW